MQAIRFGLLSCLLAASAPAQAQYWAIPEVYTVTDARVDPSVLTPQDLADLRRQAASDIPNEIGNYWRITAPDGATSFLWGTFHSNDPMLLALPEQVETQVRSARVAAFEFDPIAPSRRIFERELNAPDAWRTRDGGMATLNLPDNVRARIRSRIIGLGLGPGTEEWMTPGGLAEVLLNDPCNDFAQGVYPIQDSWLQTQAAIGGARILGLEPPQSFRKWLNHPDRLPLARDVILL